MAKSSRIITLDLIRGYFLLVILINHLNRFPGIFDVFTARGQLWTSAAEGFFLISGVLVGLVRGQEIKERKFGLAFKKALRRGLYLYVWAVALTILFTIIGTHYLGNPGVKAGLMPISLDNAGRVIWSTLNLSYVYGWTDFLQYYAVYMLLVPLGLLLLYKKLDVLVLAAAVAAFAAASKNWFFIWQLYFFGGMVIGYRWQAIEGVLKQLSLKVRTGLRFSVYAAALGVLAVNFAAVFAYLAMRRHYGAGDGELGNLTVWLGHLHDRTAVWFNRFNGSNSYGIGRIFLSLLWFSALYVFVRRHEALAEKYFGKLLVPIGTRPLKVFIFEGVIVFVTYLIFPSKTGFFVNVAINALAIAAVWLLAKLRLRELPLAPKQLAAVFETSRK